MASTIPSRPGTYPRRRRRSLFFWVGVVCIVVVLAEIGAVTNGFGLAGLLPKKSASTGPSGPNPNPYGEKIVAVVGQITYNGVSGDPFPALHGGSLCPACPKLPKTNGNFSPPVAGVWFYFNVTNAGANYSKIANFTLTTSGADPTLFVLVGVYCCYYSHYDESVSLAGFTPGTTFGFGVYATATAIPDDGTTGYSLTLHVTSP